MGKKSKILIVDDTGPGISAEGMTRLFQVFSQTDTSNSGKSGGNGLRLTISKRLVEPMNGKTGAESEEGTGSTSWVTAELAVSESPTEIPAPISEGPAPVFRKLNILLAEYNPVNQRVAVYDLTKPDHKADVAENGQEAVSLGIANKYDILLMDVKMPVLNGIEATLAILKWETVSKPAVSLPIISVAADAVREKMENFISEGMYGFISKPFKMTDLESVLKLAG